MAMQQQLVAQQQAATLLGGGYGSHEEAAMATPFHGGRPNNTSTTQWQWPAQHPAGVGGPADVVAAAAAGMRAALSAPGSVHASSSGSGYDIRFSGEYPRVATMGRSDSLLAGLQEHPPALNIQHEVCCRESFKRGQIHH